jgi:hypothetical protein
MAHDGYAEERKQRRQAVVHLPSWTFIYGSSHTYYRNTVKLTDR